LNLAEKFDQFSDRAFSFSEIRRSAARNRSRPDVAPACYGNAVRLDEHFTKAKGLESGRSPRRSGEKFNEQDLRGEIHFGRNIGCVRASSRRKRRELPKLVLLARRKKSAA